MLEVFALAILVLALLVLATLVQAVLVQAVLVLAELVLAERVQAVLIPAGSMPPKFPTPKAMSATPLVPHSTIVGIFPQAKLALLLAVVCERKSRALSSTYTLAVSHSIMLPRFTIPFQL